MDLLFYVALIPALAVTAQWLAWRTNLPSILLLLVMGIVLGNWVRPDHLWAGLTGGDPATITAEVLFPLVSIAVAVIMFEGGLSLRLPELREAGSATIRLCTLGAAITLMGAAVAARFCLGLSWSLSCLLGAILVVTGPTVIGPLLRQVKPSRRVASTLKWEGILIDPIGAVLAVLVFEILFAEDGGHEFASVAWLLIKTLTVGLVSGIGAGVLLSESIRRYWLPDHLHGIAGLGAAVLLFAISDHLAHESGLIAVTVFGIWLSNQRMRSIEHVIEFQEHLRTLLIGCLFIVLGSRLDIAVLASVGWPSLAFVIVLVVLVRPLSVLVSLVGSELPYHERGFIALLAPRGIVAAAVSSVFALRIEQTTGSEAASQLAVVTFATIIGTVAIYGLIARPVACALGLSSRSTNNVLMVGASDWVIQFALTLTKAGCKVCLLDTSYQKVTKAKLAGITAVCANFLNEHAREELPLDSYDVLMAVTQNNEVNALAVRSFLPQFGRAATFQLPFREENRRDMTQEFAGRKLFSDDLTDDQIRRLVAQGWGFKATTLSDSFTIEDFDSRYINRHIVSLIDESGNLRLIADGATAGTETRGTVIALVPEISSPTSGEGSVDA